MNHNLPDDWQEPVDVFEKDGVWAEEHPIPLEEKTKKFATELALKTALTVIKYGRHIPYCIVRSLYALHGYDSLFQEAQQTMSEHSQTNIRPYHQSQRLE